MREGPDLKAVPDDQLLRGLFEVLRKTRHDEADLVARIAEVDARQLYAREATPSMFAWWTERLHLSEAEAYLRIGAARASRRHPMLLAMLADGRLHLSGIERLAPHLTEMNREALLERAVHKTKRKIEELVAELAPRPAAPTHMRKLPARRGPEASESTAASSQLRPNGAAVLHGGPAVDGVPSAAGKLLLGGVEGSVSRPVGTSGTGAELRPDGAGVLEGGLWMDGVAPPDSQLRPNGVVRPPLSNPRPTRAPEAIALDRFRFQFDLDADFRDELERLQVLVRSSVPDGDLAKVVRLAVRRELKRLEAKRFGKTERPRTRLAQADTTPKSRHIPAAVRRIVEKRDGGRCTYKDKHGRRCTQRHDLEFHHRTLFGRGGDHSPEGLALMCRTHNVLLGLWKGDDGALRAPRETELQGRGGRGARNCLGCPQGFVALDGVAGHLASRVS